MVGTSRAPFAVTAGASRAKRDVCFSTRRLAAEKRAANRTYRRRVRACIRAGAEVTLTPRCFLDSRDIS